MSGDIGDILESFEGPRTLRYFTLLLMIVVGVLVIGSVLSSFYGIYWIEEIGITLAQSPLVLLNLAGFLALIVLMMTVAQIIFKYVE